MTFLFRLLAMIGLIWMALASVTLTALLAASWRVRKWQRTTVFQTECPVCEGTGQFGGEACSLCDGESSLMTEITDG